MCRNNLRNLLVRLDVGDEHVPTLKIGKLKPMLGQLSTEIVVSALSNRSIEFHERGGFPNLSKLARQSMAEPRMSSSFIAPLSKV
jgi:hypothetical protein